MLRTLIKKDLTAVLSTITIDRKRGKKRNPLVIVAFAILFVLIFISLGSAFFSYSLILGDVIGPDNWLYMALVGMMGLILALFGSVFSSYNTLFKPKDNALLLAMPIPTGKLLAARMVSVYLMSLLFVLIGTLPGYIYSWIEHAVSPTAIVLQIISLLFLALLVTALSCVLGWLVALVAGLFPNKTATTVIASLGFLTVYYIFFFRIQTAFQNIDPEATGRGIASYAYPMYKMGLGATGDVVSFLIFAAICVAVFAVVYIIIARSFIKIVTKTEKQHTKTYVEKRARQSSASSALLRKEFRHLLGSATYMLNCALGGVRAYKVGYCKRLHWSYERGSRNGRHYEIPAAPAGRRRMLLGILKRPHGALHYAGVQDPVAAQVPAGGHHGDIRVQEAPARDPYHHPGGDPPRGPLLRLRPEP